MQLIIVETPDDAVPAFVKETLAYTWKEGYEAAIQALRDQGVEVQFEGKTFPCPRCTSFTSLPHWDCYDETTEIIPGEA